MKPAVARLVLLLTLACFAGAQASREPLGTRDPFQSNRQWVSLDSPSEVSVAPGKTATATLKFKVSEGNHINSSRPTSNLLIPTKLTLDHLPAGVRAGKIGYPAGHDVTFPFDPGEKLNVYTGTFAVSLPITASASATPGTQQVSGELEYQACNDRACFPPKHLPVEIAVTVARAH